MTKVNNKNLLAYIDIRDDRRCYNFEIFNLSTQKELPYQEVTNLLKFFEKPPKFVKNNVKAIIVNANGFLTKDGMDYAMCQIVADKLTKLEIPFRFISIQEIVAMCKLIAGKIDPKVDKEIIQIFVAGEIFKIIHLTRTKNGYRTVQTRVIEKCYEPKILLGNLKPNKIIISNSHPFFPSAKVHVLQHCLSSWNPIILEHHVRKYNFDAMQEIVKHINDKTKNDFHIIPETFNPFCVTFVELNPTESDILNVLSAKYEDDLPLRKSCILPKFYKKFFITTKSKEGYSYLKNSLAIPTDLHCHRIKLIFKVDINHLPSLQYEPVYLPQITGFQKTLKSEETQELPIIGFFDNSSVIYIWDEKNSCYKFLNAWNGKYGKELFLDFLQKDKPVLVSSLTELQSLKGAVYDLINVMSFDPKNIKDDPKWKFSILKNDENHPILLEFDDFDNTRKAASPAFLMAFMLKTHIKAITAETEKKPKKLRFCIFDEKYDCDAKKRIQNCLQQALN
uniref:Uncharacterized protein n=1 Tax=Panagrolaimus sp. ES5 TaxID=591445 RepID=A0AC34FJY5_9BILA